MLSWTFVIKQPAASHLTLQLNYFRQLMYMYIVI